MIFLSFIMLMMSIRQYVLPHAWTLTALGASLGHSSMSMSPRVVVTTTFPTVGGSST